MNKNLLRAVIVEDEKESLNLLNNLIISNGIAEVAGSVTDPAEAVKIILSNDPDIVFLDIKMPGKSGFEVLDDLRKMRAVNPYIVFTTAFDEYAIKAFEYAAFDYLLKPIEPGRLNETFLRCIHNKKSGRMQKTDLLLDSYNKLIFRDISGVVFINPSEVIYIEAEGNYSIFHINGGRTETVTMLLGKVEDQLPPDRFLRISRSGIINLEFLKKVNTRQSQVVLLKDGSDFKFDISRSRISELISKMKDRRK